MQFNISRFMDFEGKHLKKIKFECEILTPMLLGGADKNIAELRAASIKGVLRFWWRAINAHLPLNILKDNEAAIFGDAGSKYGKSKIQIKVLDAPKYNGKRANPLPHKNAKFSYPPCFNPGEKFTLSLLGDGKIFNLLKIVSILGGLGKRSRRGFGSFIINKIDGENFVQPSSINDVFNLLDDFAKDKFELNNNTIKRVDELKVKFAFIKSVTLGNGTNNYPELLAKIGQSSHDNNSDYTGYAKGQERLASPVYVSVIKDNDFFRPVITTLNAAFKDGEVRHGIDRSEQFKKDIISGGTK